jgi:PIN domain nuclease of toxin-antitoxin system
MRYLLDTHTFIWWDSDPSHLSSRVLTICSDPASTLLLSVASVWEMQIKSQLGKLTLTDPLAILIGRQRANGVNILPISVPHVLGLEGLPFHHKDPFDRLLLAQAKVDGLTLLSIDSKFAPYSVPVVW